MTFVYTWLYNLTGNSNDNTPELNATSTTGRTDMLTNLSSHLGQSDGDYFDKNFLTFRVTATNSAGSASAESAPVYIVREVPTGSITMVSPTSASTNSTMSATFTYSNNWYNKTNISNSYIEWFAVDTIGQSLTNSNRVQIEYLSSIAATGTTTKSGTAFHTPTIANKYYYVKMTLNNSGTENAVIAINGFTPKSSVTSQSNKTVVTSAPLTAPTILSVTPGPEGGPVSVSFTGGSGPAYQMYWTSGVAPTVSVTPDASGTSSPLTDSTGPSPYTTQWYMFVRSVKTVGETSVGPSDLASSWSSGVAFTMTAPVPVNTSSPTLTGTAQVGQTVTFGVGSWSNTPTSYSLRLYRGTAGVITSETLVKDAGNVTTSTYVIQAADSGYYLRAFATATNAGGTSNGGAYTGGTEIGPITTAPPVNQTAPTISGGTRSFTLTSNGTWSPDDADGIYAYQWKYNDQGTLYLNISGETSSTLNLTTSAYDGLGIRCYVTATNAGGSVTANSNTILASAPVSAPVNATVPTLTGNLTVGSVLTFGVGTWTGSPTSYALRLYRGTANVNTSETLAKNAGNVTSSTYTITQADLDSGQLYFRAFATATNSGGTSNGGTFTAGQEKGPITAAASAPVNTSLPTISGSLSVGSTLTFGVGSWSGSPTSYALRLYRGTQFVSSGETLSKNAGNVTSSTYVITQADFNSGQLYFRSFATATNATGTSNGGTFTAGEEIGPITSAPATPAPVLSSITGNNSLALGGTFSWSFTNSPTSYSVFCTGPTGTVFTTSNAYTYTGTTFRPGYDGTGWQGAGDYTIYVSARNAGGDSSIAFVTTSMN
jgi:hypothetical protein